MIDWKLAACLCALLSLAACRKQPAAAAHDERLPAAAELAASTPGALLAKPGEAPQPPGDAAHPEAFVPLKSLQVKDAIYRAMTTAQTQRWQDGGLSGYAVPSAATGVYGCRAVRYTVDQLPDAAPQTINACK